MFRKPPPRQGDGLLELSFPGGKGGQNSPSHAPLQAQKCGPARVRLVAPVPPPRPRRIEVRISAADGRSPLGRTRALRLTDRDVEQLVYFALRLESRA